ncbi:fungal-specific transcription factor domain-containing protein [Fusarium sp. MPI-SDFR-AT-0072]|nr:fungal-specific transcription factor domain-containing protein [Fusarium sp. MPI-SDFR-AT-0072]
MDNPAAMPVTTIIQSFAPVLHRPRRNYPRCRSGCLTCRQRKKKCDEGKPNCSNCLRNHVRCRWPGPASRDDDGDSRTPTEPLQQLEPKRGGMERDAVATWNNRGVPLLSRERACSLTSVSSTLFEHYLTQTAALLVPLPMSHNPFIRLILPVAFSDDLVMHSILALSGSHLGHQQVNSVEIQHATWRHYLVVIRSLRSEIQDHAAVSDNPDKTLRLLMVLIILCHLEVISGDTKGNMFQHLRASRQLILWARSRALDGTSRPMFGFMMELYAYLVLMNILTPYGVVEQRTIPFDSFILSLSSLDEFETFGIMFGGMHSLFELIPKISVLFAQRLREDGREDEGLGPGADSCPSLQSLEMYRILRGLIDNWSLPPHLYPANDPGTCTTPGAGSDGRRKERYLSGEIYRHALSIYLAASMAGKGGAGRLVLDEIQGHVEAVLDLAPLLEESCFDYTILWPIIICGSCLVEESLKRRVLSGLSSSRYHMGHTKTACQLLDALWADPDPRAYGPYGLHLVMEKHGFSFCSL